MLGNWHVFTTLIVSCANIIVAPGNLSIISSVGMKVYNTPVKFQRDWSISHELKIMVIPYILHCGGQGCPPQCKMYENNMHQYLMMYMCNLFEILKHY